MDNQPASRLKQRSNVLQRIFNIGRGMENVSRHDDIVFAIGEALCLRVDFNVEHLEIEDILPAIEAIFGLFEKPSRNIGEDVFRQF
jgi:hypothetical protein